MTNQRPSDQYCRFVEIATASNRCDWPVLQTSIQFTGWAAVMQGGKRTVCLPPNGLPLFRRLRSNQGANLRFELLPSPSKYACGGLTADTSSGVIVATATYGVFTPYRFQVLSLLFSGSQPASKKGAEYLLSAHNLMGLNWTTESVRTMNVTKRKRLVLTRKRTRLEHSAASQSQRSRLAGMRTTASLRMVPKTHRGFFKRRRDIHSKAGQLLVNSVADKLRFVSDSAGVQTFLQRPLKLRIHWEGDQLLIWRPFIRHECIKSIYILL